MKYFVNYHLDAITTTDNEETIKNLIDRGFIEVDEKEYERMYERIWDIRCQFGY